jgi:ribonucleoside-triphosphate reductase
MRQTRGEKMTKCDANTEVYSRVVGFYRPTSGWNPGKKEEFKNRNTYDNLLTANQ